MILSALMPPVATCAPVEQWESEGGSRPVVGLTRVILRTFLRGVVKMEAISKQGSRSRE